MEHELDIKDVVKMTGLSENYIRKAIMAGKLIVTKTFKPGTKIPKNFITLEDFNKWNDSRSQHTKREDGRNKFVIYMTQEEQDQVVKMLKDLECVTTLQKAYIKPVEEVDN